MNSSFFVFQDVVHICQPIYLNRRTKRKKYIKARCAIEYIIQRYYVNVKKWVFNFVLTFY